MDLQEILFVSLMILPFALVSIVALQTYIKSKSKPKPKLKLVKQEPPPPIMGLLAQIEKDMYGSKQKVKKSKPKLVSVKRKKAARGKRK